MKPKILAAGLAMLMPMVTPGAEPGQRVPVLAELFTSEGCSSCPPADALLMDLDRKQPVKTAQIIVLSEHVDYWNSLGWKDPFSSAEFSARQTAYARALKAEVYTPQLVIDGSEQFVGSDTGAITAAITRAALRPKAPVRIVSAHRDGAEIVVGVSVPAGPGDLWIAVADERDESSVRRGENSGRTLPHVAVVRHLVKAGSVAEGFEKQVRIALAPGGQMGGTRIVAFLVAPGGRVVGVNMFPLAQ